VPLPNLITWLPAGMLALGAAVNIAFVSGRVQAMPLPISLETIPREVLGLQAEDLPISEAEQKVAGMSSFIMRTYTPVGAERMQFSIYVGYYDEQRQGKSIHSPRNCLPGAGWETVGFRPVTIATPNGPATVNRYHLVKGPDQSVVYYWYQGRGRIAYNEYGVKLELLRDAALLGRTEEALVRIVVPVVNNDHAAADSIATRVARDLAPAVNAVLPPR
jgi:EpsI family protein